MSNKLLFLLLGFLIVLSACKNRKKTLEKVETDFGTVTQSQFKNLLVKDTIPYKYFSSKIDLTVENDGKSNSVKMFLKTTRDSAIQANFTVMRIPLLRAHITTDSVTITQNRNKCYTLASQSELSNLLPADIDYPMLQAILHGEVFGLDTAGVYYLIEEDKKPVLSTHSEKITALLDKEKYHKVPENIQVMRYYLNDSLNRVNRIRIHLPSDSAEVNVFYDERTFIDGMFAPLTTRLTASSPRNDVNIKLEYGKHTLNEPHYLSFSIPDNYEPCP